jgi:hypothetical protein
MHGKYIPYVGKVIIAVSLLMGKRVQVNHIPCWDMERIKVLYLWFVIIFFKKYPKTKINLIASK